MAKATAIGPVTNGGQVAIELRFPYIARVQLTGVSDMLFHRWNVEAMREKQNESKGSRGKKTDDLPTYVYRTESGELAVPGNYLTGSICGAAKFRQDPRSPRKSAMELFKAGVLPLTELATLGIKDWHYEHACRAPVQRQGITRVRPAIKAGWTATFDLLVNLPEYISPDILHDVIVNAGRLIGIADYRPTYGRFSVTAFEVVNT
jgi:hypothetical protein